MYKELVICIIVISLIIVLNVITETYTEKSINSMNENLENLKVTMLADEKEETSKKIEEILSNWNDKYQKLAYYIEHDELEKVKTELISLRSNIEVDEYNQGIPSLDKCVFILEHIKEKSALQIKNIF